jgi:hypothetical protein
VLVVGLQDGDTDPEELHQDVHLVLLAGLVLNLQTKNTFYSFFVKKLPEM